VVDVNSAETIERVPINTDADGVVRVAGTRVTLDTIVAAFDAGATAEEIAQQYSSVALVDVYSVITYYLRHKSEVCAYLTTREDRADQVRDEVERRFPSAGLRERLLARRRWEHPPMLRIAADENFNGDVVRGLLRRNPNLDIVRVQDVGLSGADDASVLQWAADQGRIIVTHDISTLGSTHSIESQQVSRGQGSSR
jgi:uncharacterized protein (DUF433 family)